MDYAADQERAVRAAAYIHTARDEIEEAWADQLPDEDE